MHVSEFVFCNIYHILEQMSECQKPLMILIFDFTVHQYFTVSTVLFLSCPVAVTTELTCYLNVHTSLLWQSLAHKIRLNCTETPSTAASHGLLS